jgi:hypothetical protein
VRRSSARERRFHPLRPLKIEFRSQRFVQFAGFRQSSLLDAKAVYVSRQQRKVDISNQTDR